MKKDDGFIVFYVGAVDGTCSAILTDAGVLNAFFAPLTRLLSRRGLKTAHCAVFLTSRSSPVSLVKKNTHTRKCEYFFGAVDGT